VMYQALSVARSPYVLSSSLENVTVST